MRLRGVLFAVLGMCLALAAPAAAQQTGAISGKVVDTGGGVLPGVTVEARSDVLPGPRETVTDANGEYRLPALPPGNYTVKFELVRACRPSRARRRSSCRRTPSPTRRWASRASRRT